MFKMIKLNNKGMSLMELLVTIVLISIVLTFLFQLLLDLKNETENNDFAYHNQFNRTEAIYKIQMDLMMYPLVGISDVSTNDNIILNWDFKKGNNIVTAILKSETVTKKDELGTTNTIYYLKYHNVLGEDYTWEIKGGILDLCGNFNYYIDNTSNNYYFKINFPIYNLVNNSQNNSDYNNAVDDFEITYSSNTANLVTTNGAYLNTKQYVNKQIGICTN